MDGLKIIERGLWSSLSVFAETNFNIGKIDGLQLNILRKLYKFVSSSDCYERDYVIFLDMSDPNIALERINRRSRLGENNISINYWMSLNREFQTEYLSNFNKFRYRKVFRVNAEQPLDQVVNDVEEIIKSVSEED
jgi:thymidylate kinase